MLFSAVSHEYTRKPVDKLVFLLSTCCLLQQSQLRTQKGRGEIIFPPYNSLPWSASALGKEAGCS